MPAVTDDDNEVRQTSNFEAQGFNSPYLNDVLNVFLARAEHWSVSAALVLNAAALARRHSIKGVIGCFRGVMEWIGSIGRLFLSR